jgi:hypothetical protein
MYHRSLNIKDLAFILDNMLDQHGKTTKRIVDSFDPTERVTVQAYFRRQYPYGPLDVSMFESTVCGDCGEIIHQGRCLCEDRNMDIDLRYSIHALHFMGDAFYTIHSKDKKEFFTVRIDTIFDNVSCKKGNKILSEEDAFFLVYGTLQQAQFITKKEFEMTDIEQELLRECEAADRAIGGGM